MTVPPHVLCAARELLGLKQVTAAEAAGIARRTIQRLEAGDLDQRHTSVVLHIYYEKQGIEFVHPAEGMGWDLFDNRTEFDVLPISRCTKRIRRATQTHRSANLRTDQAANRLQLWAPQILYWQASADTLVIARYRQGCR